jgi:PBP1b-binding outer membrane lipoprotein LpoB
MKTLTITAVLFSAALAMGCSSSETQNPVPSTGTPAGTATPAPSDTPPADPAPVDTTPAVKSPTIQEIMKMAGALHVTWTNAEASCDAIELERKTATAAYKVVATLPGEADNKHDGTATAATMYTYRVRCKKAAAYSEYSNEMSASPK